MNAVRSNTGRNFRRDGVTFEPERWTLVEELTPAQEEEVLRGILLCVEDAKPNESRLRPFPVIGEEEQTEEELVSQVEQLRAELAARDQEIAQLKAELGKSKKSGKNGENEPPKE